MNFIHLQGDEQSRPMEPFRVAASDNLRQLVNDVRGRIEQAAGPRRRGRRAVDQQAFEATVTALVCDLVHRHLTKAGGWIAVPMSNAVLGSRNRYRPPAFNKKLRTWARALASSNLGTAELRLGHQGFAGGGGKRTVLRAGPRLVTMIEGHGITMDDLGRSPGGETIILRAGAKSRWDTADKVPYQDTPDTIHWRLQMDIINAWIVGADIGFDGRHDSKGEPVDDEQRHLYRVFNRGTFTKGGRMYGGFWIELSKQDRHNGMYIEGEGVTSLDYGQMIVRTMYGAVGVAPPEGDLYALHGFDHRHRPGIKMVFNAMVGSGSVLTRFPKGTRRYFRRGTTFAEVRDAIIVRHQPVAHLFYSGMGLEGMFTESQIMVDILLQLRRRGIVGLPVHDCLIVGASHEGIATEIMAETFMRHTGVAAVIERE